MGSELACAGLKMLNIFRRVTCNLFIIGNMKVLSSRNTVWKRLLDHCKEDKLATVQNPFQLKKFLKSVNFCRNTEDVIETGDHDKNYQSATIVSAAPPLQQPSSSTPGRKRGRRSGRTTTGGERQRSTNGDGRYESLNDKDHLEDIDDGEEQDPVVTSSNVITTSNECEPLQNEMNDIESHEGDDIVMQNNHNICNVSKTENIVNAKESQAAPSNTENTANFSLSTQLLEDKENFLHLDLDLGF